MKLSKLIPYWKHVTNGGWVLLVNVLQQLMGLILMMVMVRVFSANDVGQYQLIVASVGLAGMFVLPGIQAAIVQSVARGFDGTYRRGMQISFLGSLLGSVTLVAVGLYQGHEGKYTVMAGALVAAAAFPFAQGLQSWEAYFAGHRQFRMSSLIQSAGSFIAYGSAAAVLWVFDVSVWVVILVTSGLLGLLNLSVSAHIYRRIPRSELPEPGAIPYGLRTSVFNAFNIAGNHADKFLIFFFLSPSALAIYGVAERLPELVKKYMQALRVVLVPALSQRQAYSAALDRKFNLVSIALSVGIAVLALLVVPWFIPLAFTDAYADAVLYCQLLLGTLVIGQAATVKFTYILSKLDSRSYRDIMIGSNLVRLVASFALVPAFGILGAVASTAIYRVSNAVLVSICLRRLNGENKLEVPQG